MVAAVVVVLLLLLLLLLLLRIVSFLYIVRTAVRTQQY